MSRRGGPALVVARVCGAVYALVLLAGLYYVIGGLGEYRPLRTVGFVAGIGLLFGLEFLVRRREPAQRVAVLALLARLVLYFAVVALDESSLSRALFVLVPFIGYLTLGRTVGLVLGGLCLALLVAGFAVWVPGWYREPNYVSDVLMFGLGVIMAIAMAEVAAGERRAAARVADLSAATERNRLARDIHDSLGHHLTAISVQLEKASAFRDRDPEVAERALADVRGSARRALDDVRASVGALRTPAALPVALAELVEQTGGPEVSLRIEGEERATDPATATALYRAAQEAITNARRHGGADRVTVTVSFGSADTRLVVADDGRGFRPEDPDNHQGFGLLGLRERAALVGGVVTVESRPGAGTRITVTVPRRDPAALRS